MKVQLPVAHSIARLRLEPFAKIGENSTSLSILGNERSVVKWMNKQHMAAEEDLNFVWSIVVGNGLAGCVYFGGLHILSEFMSEGMEIGRHF
jgi:hypothetical protein